MRIAALGSIVMLCSLGSASATTISGSVTGRIGPALGIDLSTDVSGLYGPVGGNLEGDPFTLTYTYNTADFSAGQSPCENCTLYLSTIYQPVTSVAISFTVNGIAQGFAGTTYDDLLEFANAPSTGPISIFTEELFTIIPNPGGGPYVPIERVYLDLGSSPSVAFGQPLNEAGSYPGDITFNGSLANETLTFQTAPEPGSLALLGTGLLAVCAMSRKRPSLG